MRTNPDGQNWPSRLHRLQEYEWWRWQRRQLCWMWNWTWSWEGKFGLKVGHYLSNQAENNISDQHPILRKNPNARTAVWQKARLFHSSLDFFYHITNWNSMQRVYRGARGMPCEWMEKVRWGMQRPKRPAQPLLANWGAALKVNSCAQRLISSYSQRIARATKNREASKERNLRTNHALREFREAS